MVKTCRLVLVRLLVTNEGAAFYSSGWIVFPPSTLLFTAGCYMFPWYFLILCDYNCIFFFLRLITNIFLAGGGGVCANVIVCRIVSNLI